MSRVYTFRCPHCGNSDCNVWTRDGTRWYFCPHAHPKMDWNGSAWVSVDCRASNSHVPLMIAKHMRRVFEDARPALRRWYQGRTAGRCPAAQFLDRFC